MDVFLLPFIEYNTSIIFISVYITATIHNNVVNLGLKRKSTVIERMLRNYERIIIKGKLFIE